MAPGYCYHGISFSFLQKMFSLYRRVACDLARWQAPCPPDLQEAVKICWKGLTHSPLNLSTPRLELRLFLQRGFPRQSNRTLFQ